MPATKSHKSQNNTPLTILKPFVTKVSVDPPQVFVITLINLLLMVTVFPTNTAFPLSALVLLTPHKYVRRDAIKRNGENYSSKTLK